MIRKIYEMMEKQIEMIDEENKERYQKIIKANKSKKFKSYLTCLERIKVEGNYEEKIVTCIDAMRDSLQNQKDINNFLKDEETNLYNCINRNYLLSKSEDLNQKENIQILNDIDLCLKKYGKNIASHIGTIIQKTI